MRFRIPPERPSRYSLLASLCSHRLAYAFIAALAFSLYANTLGHDFVLDDGLVLQNNQYVKNGLAGIPDLLRHDSFHGAIGTSEYLSGGRYRPLSLVLFALEVELFGVRASVHHLFNVLWNALVSVVVLWYLRRLMFPNQPVAALVTALLFTVHPIHTEVVANIKSRDELLSLFFLMLVLIRLHVEVRKNIPHLLSALWYFLALLSKENGIIFLVLLPLWLMLTEHVGFPQALRATLPFLTAFSVYAGMRLAATGWPHQQVTEVMDNPYLLASFSEQTATIAVVLLRYLRLLFLPVPLTYDYSYQHIAYASWGQLLPWLSVVLHGILAGLAWLLRTRQPRISWSIVFYLLTLLLVSNLLFNIGTFMAERFLFQASLPMLTLLGFVVFRMPVAGIVPSRTLMVCGSLLLAATVALATRQTLSRNGIWKNNATLLLHDVATSSRSGRAQTYAGIANISLGDTSSQANRITFYHRAVDHLHEALDIQPTYLPALLNLGLAYSRLDSLHLAERYWLRAKALKPENPTLKKYLNYLFHASYQKGVAAGWRKQYDSAVYYFSMAARLDSTHAETWYNLGGALYEAGDYDLAIGSFERCLSIKPDHELARSGLSAARYRRQAKR